MGSKLWLYSFSSLSRLIYFLVLWDLLNLSYFLSSFESRLLWLTSPSPLYSKCTHPVEYVFRALSNVFQGSLHRTGINSTQSLWNPTPDSPPHIPPPAKVFFCKRGVLTRWLNLTSLQGVCLAHEKLMYPHHVKLWDCRLPHWGTPSIYLHIVCISPLSLFICLFI